jgi:hypothetical protein
MIAHVYAFSELIEPAPCTTDLQTVRFDNIGYHDSAGDHSFAHAVGHYNGNQTPSDANCSNTNLRSPAAGTAVDKRMVPRGTNGGLTAEGPLW